MIQPVKKIVSLCYITEDMIFSAELWFSTFVYVMQIDHSWSVLFLQMILHHLGSLYRKCFHISFPTLLRLHTKATKCWWRTVPAPAEIPAPPCGQQWSWKVVLQGHRIEEHSKQSVALHSLDVSSIKQYFSHSLSLSFFLFLVVCYLGLQGYVIPPHCTVTVPLLREPYLAGSQ